MVPFQIRNAAYQVFAATAPVSRPPAPLAARLGETLAALARYGLPDASSRTAASAVIVALCVPPGAVIARF